MQIGKRRWHAWRQRFLAGVHVRHDTCMMCGPLSSHFSHSSACREFSAIIYLNDVPTSSGGATELRFPNGSTVAVQPVIGSALVFRSEMIHRGSRLTAGEKLIWNQWVRSRR